MIKIPVDAPKSMINFCKTPEARNKPYDICLTCPFMSESCDGPNILAMEYPRWIEWAKERLKRQGMSRAELSEKSGVPVSTIASALSGTSYDIKTDTMRRITKALVGGCWGQYPCHFAALLMDGVDLEEDTDSKKLAAVQEELEQLRANLNARIQEVKADEKTKIEYLKDQVIIRDKHLENKNRTIALLTAAVAVLGVLSVVGAVI